jgi:hypothetical protein
MSSSEFGQSRLPSQPFKPRPAAFDVIEIAVAQHELFNGRVQPLELASKSRPSSSGTLYELSPSSGEMHLTPLTRLKSGRCQSMRTAKRRTRPGME